MECVLSRVRNTSGATDATECDEPLLIGEVWKDEVDLELKDLQQTTVQGQVPRLQLLTFDKANNQEAVTSTTTVINLKVTSKDVHKQLMKSFRCSLVAEELVVTARAAWSWENKKIASRRAVKRRTGMRTRLPRW